MFFFKKPLLSKERKKALDGFREQAVSALAEMEKASKDGLSQELYAGMRRNVENTPIIFYPRKTLKEKIYKFRGRVFGSVVKGEHVNQIRIYQKGRQRFVVQSNYINMPAFHVFEGNRLTVDGIFTLAHEYAHFPKPALGAFARANEMSYEQAEELLADALSAKLAVKLGYPREKVLGRFSGRGLVYGRIPFRKFIQKAAES